MVIKRQDIFAGRQSELETLSAAFESARNGQGQLVVVSGEAGIGKTRLCEEFLDRIGGNETQIIRAWCSEDMETPPYWPWTQVVRSIAQSDPAGFEEFLSTSGGELIAEILPERSAVLRDSNSGDSLRIDEHRFRLFDCVSRWVASRDPVAPRIVFLDDVHAADFSSQQLLKFLAREINEKPFLLLATNRTRGISDPHFIDSTLNEITRHRWVQRLVLGPLDGTEIESIIRATAGDTVSVRLTSEVTEHSGGNPLFAVELARSFEESGKMGAGPLPGAIKEAIADRLRRISVDCLRMLEFAAVVGRGFELEFLRSLLDPIEIPNLPTLISEAIDTNVIKRSPHTLSSYTFTHPLVQQTLYQGIPDPRRKQLHGDIAKTIESENDGRTEFRAAELAHHFCNSSLEYGNEQVIHYSILAGRSAFRSLALQEAHQHFTRALEYMTEGTTLRRAEATAALAVTNFAEVPASSKARGWLLLKEAFEMYLSVGEHQRGLDLAGQIFPLWAREGVVEFYQRTLEIAEPGTLLTGKLHTRMAIGLSDSGRPDEAMQQLELADRIAVDTENSWLKGRIAIQKAQVMYRMDRCEEALPWARRAAQMAVIDDDGEHQKSALQWQVFSLISTGQLSEAEAANADLFAVARKTRVPFHTWTAISQGWNLARMRGDWDRAYEVIEQGADLGPEDGYVDLLRLGIEADQAGLDMDSGLFAKWQEQIDQDFWRDTGPTIFNHICGIPELQAQISRLADEGTDRFPNRLSKIRRAIVLGLIAYANQDATAAATHYEYLKTVQRSVDEVLDISTERARGLLSSTTGEFRQASAHFERAIEFCEKIGYLTEVARACCNYAELMNKSDFERSPGKYSAIFEKGMELSRTLGMQPLMQAFERLETHAAPRTDETESPDSVLTERETTVLKLLATGLSNQQIADELFVSRHTVNNHVAHIFQKLNVKNRVEAATYAVEMGLSASTGNSE